MFLMRMLSGFEEKQKVIITKKRKQTYVNLKFGEKKNNWKFFSLRKCLRKWVLIKKPIIFESILCK